MINHIRSWIDHRNDRIRLEAMSDRLLADLDVERADIHQWLKGETPSEDAVTVAPWARRLRLAAAAFMRELRPGAHPTGALSR